MFKKNKIIVFLIFLIIILIVSFIIKKYLFTEGFGYTSDPSDYIEPKVYPNFITKEEADYIFKISKNNFEKSLVLDGYDNSIRKSKTAWLDKNDSIIKNIIKRVCEFGNHPFENTEDLQVVKYKPNGYYNEHHDSCCDGDEHCSTFFKRGGNRIVTMIIYLNDDFEGGATRFINLDKNIKPDKYSGILFYPLNKKKDNCHINALHAGMPVISGEKYIANVWIREREFQ